MHNDRPMKDGALEAAIKKDFFLILAGDVNLVGKVFMYCHLGHHMW